ncbi:MAG: T9SS type A sorting domain-containing protein [Ignavibacteriales bacterium]|nr:T9SS type A sorting domain-containing protein [Ignavibacteriales bacterium]
MNNRRSLQQFFLIFFLMFTIRKFFLHRVFCLFLFLLFVTVPDYSNNKNTKEERASSAITSKQRAALININNISMWASDNGMMEQNPNDLSAGVSFPRGRTTVVNKGGLIWGGKVLDGNSQVVRVGGQTFRSGTVPGRVISPGIVENSENPDVRIYRIRRDWETADLKQDASEFFDMPEFNVTDTEIQILREQYRIDWLEWPWQKGAPYYERNGIPGYQPDPDAHTDLTTDEPGLGNADQDHFDDLQNVIFQRYRIIYKGTSSTPPNSSIDSMYLAKWVDTDIGNYSDDFVGCAPRKDLGYGYNANSTDTEFDKYKITPAAVGYCLLQGPRVPSVGSIAKWDLSDVAGFKNLPMTTFTFFSGSTRSADLVLGDYDGTSQMWNLIRGYKHKPVSPPTCLIDLFTNQCTNFELSGDPELYHGWIDGQPDSAGDRRFAIISGPFSLAFGDSQEVVFALTAGTGTDSRNGIGIVKQHRDAAHDAYYLDFDFLAPVPSPYVRVVELDNKIILDWESDTTHMKEVESYYSRGYRFETYTIYQFPSADTSSNEAIVYQFFDPTQPRLIYITQDKLRNRPLVNGQKYYFAITASVYNPDSLLSGSRIESPIVIHEVIPHSPNPGTILPYEIGDTLSAPKNVYGENDAVVNVTYFDPSKTDGHTYEVLFHRNADPWIDFEEKPKWSLIDLATNDTLINSISVDQSPRRVITRGFSIESLMPRHGLKVINQIQYKYQSEKAPIFETPNPAGDFMIVGPGTSTLDTLKGQHHADSDIEVRFLGDSSWSLLMGPTAVTSKWVRVPYTAWERRVRGSDTLYRRLYSTVINENDDSLWRPSDLLSRTYDGKPMKVFQSLAFIIDSVRIGNSYLGGQYFDDLPYRTDMAYYRGFLWFNGQYGSRKVTVSRAYIADLDDDGEPAPLGTIIRFEPFKEIRNGEKKHFTTQSINRTDYEAAKKEVGRVNVFPNPYYGMNRAELNRFQRFVTFNHLSRFSTIRIFNLAGVLVKTIRKDDDTQFATWDLNNENGLPVAGGLYIAHLELKDALGRDLGEKILKLMIVPEDQSLELN